MYICEGLRQLVVSQTESKALSKSINAAKICFQFCFTCVSIRSCKGRRKQGNTVAEAKMRPGHKKCFWKISKAFFASKMKILCLQHMLRGETNEESLRKH